MELVDSAGRCYPIREPEGLLGRAPECLVAVPDPSASWRHARLRVQGEALAVEDLGSTNGTWLNHQLLPPGQTGHCRPGDWLRIGQWQAVCQASGPALPAGPVLAPDGNLLIGRDPAADIVLADPLVSWHHARLVQRPEGQSLEDLGSANGTFVNGQRIRQQLVAPTDEILIARQSLRLGAAARPATGCLLEAAGLWRMIHDGRQWRPLLQNVSLRLTTEGLVSLVGPSGAGKSTLVAALTGEMPAERGSVRFRGVDVYRNPGLLQAALGMVPQDSAIHPELTVRQVLHFAAWLRLPVDQTAAERTRRYLEVAEQVALSGRLDARVRQLSGGERKRVNIAVELLTEPDLLILDEPTSGLDPGLEKHLGELLAALARGGRLVLVVTHSPALMARSDELIFMRRGGQVAYQGSPREALAAFGVPDYGGLFDSARDAAASPGQPLVAAETPAPRGLPPGVRRPPGLRTTGILTARYLACLAADPRNLAVLLLQAPVLGLLIAVLFAGPIFATEQLPDAFGHRPIDDSRLLLLSLTVSAVWMGLVNSVRELLRERPIYRRERLGIVGWGPLLASRLLILPGLACGQVLVLVLIVGPASQLPEGRWPDLALILWLAATCLTSLGLLLSTVARSADQAMSIAVMLMVQQLLFSGLIRPLEDMGGLRWLAELTAMRWAIGGSLAAVHLPDRLAALPAGVIMTELLETRLATAAQVLVVLTLGQCLLAWLVGKYGLKPTGRE